jgi:hypothetical protein
MLFLNQLKLFSTLLSQAPLAPEISAWAVKARPPGWSPSKFLSGRVPGHDLDTIPH